MDDLEKNSIQEFTQWADNYDRPINSFTFRRTNEKIVSLLSPKSNSFLLDVECGTGILIQIKQSTFLYLAFITEGTKK